MVLQELLILGIKILQAEKVGIPTGHIQLKQQQEST